MARIAAARQIRPAPSSGTVTDLGLLRDILGFRLRRIQNHLSQTFTARLSGKNIRPGEFSALAIIAANPGISQIELSREGGFDKATIVALIDDLEHWGWAKRKRSSTDRRRHSLFTTPAGNKALAELFSIASENEKAIHDVLSDRELKSLYAMLDKIYDRCFPENGGA